MGCSNDNPLLYRPQNDHFGPRTVSLCHHLHSQRSDLVVIIRRRLVVIPIRQEMPMASVKSFELVLTGYQKGRALYSIRLNRKEEKSFYLDPSSNIMVESR